MNIRLVNKTFASRSCVKTLLLAWMLSMCVCGSFADDITKIDGDFDFMGIHNSVTNFIPVEFTSGNSPLLFFQNGSYDSPTLSIYDENLSLQKTINDMPFMRKEFPYKYQEEERDIIADKVSEEMTPTGKAFKDLGASYVGGICMWMMDKSLNGDTIIWFGDDKYDDRNYYHREKFGWEYPINYHICKNGMIYSVSAQYNYHYSDWRVTNSHEGTGRSGALVQFYYTNANLGIRNERYFIPSQTLFNQDDKFEYAITNYKSVPGFYVTEEKDQNSDFITKRHVEFYKEVFTGIQIVSETGEVLYEIDNDKLADYYYEMGVLVIGDHTYLVTTGWEYIDGQETGTTNKTYFYEINRETSSISKAKVVDSSFMSIEPMMPKKNSTVNVTFGDDNKDGSQIVVVSASGARVKSMNVPAGQKSAQFSVNGASGMYCVSRTQKNKPNEIKKIIVK